MSRRVKDDMELSFDEINKKSKVGLIIFIIFLLLIVGAFCYYYFVIDSPKKLFLTAVNSVVEKIEINEEPTKTIEYKIKPNITKNSEDEVTNSLLDVISDATFEGNLGIDNETESAYLDFIVNYKEKLLLDFSTYAEGNSNQGYLKMNNFFDKVIEITLEAPTSEESTETPEEYNIEDLKTIVASLKKHLSDVLQSAKYTKTITKLNDEYVKKITLLCDKEFYSDLYGKLIEDEEFIKSYALAEDKTEEEVIDEFNEEIANLEDGVEELSIYLTIFDNKFLMLEDDAGQDYLKVEKINNRYEFEMTEEYNLLVKGYVEVKTTNDITYLNISFEDIEEEMIIDLEIEYSVDTTKEINVLDKTNAVKYEELTEDDYLKIGEKLLENEAFNLLIEDLNLEELLNSTLSTEQGI